MRLKDLVQIDSRFEKSVNLLLDLNDRQKLNAYIPTRSSINILKDYLEEINTFSGRRANILIGPYGKGKSHLLLVLLSLLSGFEVEEIRALIDRVDNIDHDAASIMRDVYLSSKFLPVVINTNSGHLGQAFVRSLNQALNRDGLGDVVPDNYFAKAINVIKRWEELYPSTYKELEKNISGTVDTFIHKLESYDYDALDEFRRVHPLITSGSDFNPIVDDETISVYRSINHTICTKYGYTGIYIVFDEFSKYIEGHTKEGFSADMKLLQDICELCNSSKEEQLHLTCVAHKAIRAYGEELSKDVMNAFRGVEGRLIEIPFIVSSQNNYELIADAIRKKDAFYQWKNNEEYTDMIQKSYQIPEFRALFIEEDFQTIVGDGCFPLTPLGSYLLLNLSEKIAQNERTIFTFLSGRDLYSLNSYIDHSDTVSFVGTELIYDYFSSLFEGERNTAVHNEWLKAEYALSKVGSHDEEVVVKSLAVIKMVNRSDDIPAKAIFLQLASGLKETDCLVALEALIAKGLVVLKKSNATYDFQNGVGINVENEVADYTLKHFSKVEVTTVLNDVCRRRYILPKKYNQNYYMTRYYRIMFMSPDSFMALSSSDYLDDKNEPDGFLVILYGDAAFDKEVLLKHHKDICDNKVVLGIPQMECNLAEKVKTYCAVQKMMSNQEYLSDKEVILKELELLELELDEQMNDWMEEAVNGLDTIYLFGEELTIGKYGINRAISDICEKVYYKTPIVNHELINRHHVSPQVAKARERLLDDILHCRIMEQYETGTSAESTIYRALMKHTLQDDNLLLVKREINAYIHECKGQAIPFSKLIDRLVKSPYGIRKGIVPIFIMEQLVALDDMPVVYLGSKELSIDAGLLSNVIGQPESYALYVEEETGQKLEYIENLEKLFGDYGAYCREIEGRNRLSRVICFMQAWYRSLPQAAVTFKKADYDGQIVKTIDLFRKLLNGAVNPREVLFDKIPRLFAKDHLAETYTAIAQVKEEIDNHINVLKQKAIIAIQDGLSLDRKDDLLLSIQAWYTELPDVVKHSVFTSDTQRLLNALRELKTTNPEDIAEKISKIVTGFFIEDWSDSSLDEFARGINSLAREVDDRAIRATTNADQKVMISTEAGVKELVYEFDPENISASGYFFQNALDEMVEEYGESLDNSEKIGILMQMVKKLIG